MHRRDGATLWTRISGTVIRDRGGEPLYVVRHVVDVSDTKELTDRLAYEATHDPLTGLATRAVLVDSLTHRLARARQDQLDVAVLAVDLDGFKEVNDRCGHPAGDRVLIDAAGRLEAQVRDTDLVVRLGGDEFIVLLGPPTSTAAAAATAQRLIAVLSQPYPDLPAGPGVGASVGVAVVRSGDAGVDACLKDADEALYRAKAAGGSAHAVLQVAARRD